MQYNNNYRVVVAGASTTPSRMARVWVRVYHLTCTYWWKCNHTKNELRPYYKLIRLPYSLSLSHSLRSSRPLRTLVLRHRRHLLFILFNLFTCVSRLSLCVCVRCTRILFCSLLCSAMTWSVLCLPFFDDKNVRPGRFNVIFLHFNEIARVYLFVVCERGISSRFTSKQFVHFVFGS